MPEPQQGPAAAAPAAAAPETLAALVAQMRRWNKEGVTLVNTGYIADRIERAAKNTENAFGMALAIEDGLRKRDKQSAPGNAAALREALEQCGRALEKAQCSSAFQAANAGSSYITAALSSAHAVLSAPARNCDRPECADVESAWATCCAETNRADCKGFARWLFAPAKGGDHA